MKNNEKIIVDNLKIIIQNNNKSLRSVKIKIINLYLSLNLIIINEFVIFIEYSQLIY